MSFAFGAAHAEGDTNHPSTSMSPSGDATTSQGSMSNSGMSGNLDSQTVRQVQQALANKGHDPGPIDGIMGPRTRAAVQEYQRSQNLTDSTGLDRRTLESLGVQASASGTTGSDTNPSGMSRSSGS
jgi:peptidoglycan hydrolase-like protein with peptidoglycan-binding domain